MGYRSKYTGSQLENILDNAQNKQDKISDLETIRSGARKGATALQSIPSEYVTETELNNKGYATISALDNKMDKVTLATVATTGNYNDLSNKPTIPSAVTESTVSGWGFAKSSALQTKAEDSSVVHKTGNETITGAKTFNSGVNFLGSGDSNAVTLSTNTRINVNGTNKTVLGFGSGTFYINHGDYNLILRGKDTRPMYNSTTLALSSDIPAAVTENTVSGWGFTKNTGTYSKPSGGIPKTDLASAVQTSLGKADTALQSYTEQYKGTVTGVKINGTTKNPSSGIVDLGTVITAHQPLKTINGQAIEGVGDITISGGGAAGANVMAVDTGDVVEDVNISYATTDYVDVMIDDINNTIGDINSILESIINGGVNVSIFPITLSYNVDGNETYAKVYAELDKISNKNSEPVSIDPNLIFVDLTTFAVGLAENSYEVSHITFEGDNTYSLGDIESGPEMYTIMLSSDGTVWCLSQ